MISLILILGIIAVSISSGLGYISAWWILVIAFADAVWGITTGPMYDHVMSANRRGDLRAFPRVLAIQTMARLIPSFIIYGISSIFS